MTERGARRPTALRLGVGMDLPWGGAIGFDPLLDAPNDRMTKFLGMHAEEFSYLVFSFQPNGSAPLNAAYYLSAYRRLVEHFPGVPVAMHHTMLNLGSVPDYDRRPAAEFVNAVNEAITLDWVVEDLGMWSLRGVPMPYPLPPYLVAENVEHVARNIADAAGLLDVPLRVEFPGFTDGVTVAIGDMDAYDFFGRTIRAAGVDATLDVGHLLSWRWWKGHRGHELYDGLEQLPLDAVRELHLSGSAISRGRFLDLHHGVLLEEQFVLAELLVERCPRLTDVTYEDPNYGRDGVPVLRSVPSIARLKELVAQ